jgi:hypothetical protein
LELFKYFSHTALIVLPVPTGVAANVVRLLLLLLTTTKHLLEEMELRTRKSSKAQEN